MEILIRIFFTTIFLFELIGFVAKAQITPQKEHSDSVRVNYVLLNDFINQKEFMRAEKQVDWFLDRDVFDWNRYGDYFFMELYFKSKQVYQYLHETQKDTLLKFNYLIKLDSLDAYARRRLGDQIFTMSASDIPQFVTEIAPEPKIGFEEWYKQVNQLIELPPEVLEKGIKKRIFVQFIVERDGSLSDFKILNESDTQLNEELIRVLKLMPKWKPAYNSKGEKARKIVALPIQID